MTGESWRPLSPWSGLSEAEREFWTDVLAYHDDPITIGELLGSFLATGRSNQDVDWPLVMVQWVLGSMSRYERERLYADYFFAPFDLNDGAGLPG